MDGVWMTAKDGGGREWGQERNCNHFPDLCALEGLGLGVRCWRMWMLIAQQRCSPIGESTSMDVCMKDESC